MYTLDVKRSNLIVERIAGFTALESNGTGICIVREDKGGSLWMSVPAPKAGKVILYPMRAI